MKRLDGESELLFKYYAIEITHDSLLIGPTVPPVLVHESI
jgi:hypothetical protein